VGIWLQYGSDWSTVGVKIDGIGLVRECQGYKTSGCVMGNESIGLDARFGEEVISTHQPGHMSIDVRGIHPPHHTIQSIGKEESVTVPVKTSLTVTLSVD
jgi:hypothetical protein